MEVVLKLPENGANGGVATLTPQKRKRRPARKQVAVGQILKKQPEQTGQTYNIWYNKWAGGDKYDSYLAKEKSQTRCVIATDSGYTRADGTGNKYCCLFFARGCCPLGSECTYLHRLPLSEAQLPDSSLDVFGREKHADYRDDMGGVGSFTRQNRTVYVGRIRQTRDMDEIVERHFSEWGVIEKIKLLQARGVAFVTYVSELHAQFAKEAMMHQSLDNDEVLNVRWATEDPNPTAKVAEKRRLEDLGETGIAKRLPGDLVRAVREMDELEGIVGPREESFDSEDDLTELEAASKRVKTSGLERLLLDNSAQSEPPASLSSAILSTLRNVAAVQPKQPNSALADLSGYGTDDD